MIHVSANSKRHPGPDLAHRKPIILTLWVRTGQDWWLPNGVLVYFPYAVYHYNSYPNLTLAEPF